MNNDENISQETLNDPALEARIVAVVLGEASAFEAAEVGRLVHEKPAVAAFKHHIEQLHGFVATAVRPEMAPLQLAPERRANLMRIIGDADARDTNGGPNAPVMLELEALRKKRRRQAIWRSAIAASLMLVATLVVTMAPGRRSGDRSTADLRAKEDKTREEAMTAVESARQLQQESKARAASASSLPEKTEFSAPAPVPIYYAAISLAKPSAVNGLLASSGTPQSLSLGAVSSGSPPFSNAPSISASFEQAPRTEVRAESKSWGGVFHLPPSLADKLPFTEPSPGFVSESSRFYSVPLTSKKSTLLASSGTPPSLSLGTVPIGGGAALDANVNEEPIVLSPFEVTANEEGGYRASSTLAGSRMRTSLADVRADVLGKWDGQRRGKVGATRSEPTAVAFDAHDGFLAGLDQAASGAASSLKKAEASEAVKTDEQLSAAKKFAGVQPATEPDVSRAEISTAKEAVSTFSLHVSDVSFKLAQAALARGEMPDPSRIRPEEFYNAFDYGDPSPSNSDKITCRIEQSAHPILQQRNLVRIAMKVPSAGRAASQPLSLTVLLDTSGSMERQDRAASVQRALTQLASLLTAQDHVTLIGFARQPRLLAEALPGDQAAQLAELARTTPYTGGTNIEEALKLAGELAQRHRQPTGQNRVVLVTDGAANLGNANPAELVAMIEKLRQSGVAFDACGVGTDGLDDTVLEALTRKGDGRYYVLDQPEDADAGFAHQLAGAFRPAAENVKVQVRFNPARVGRYRLIGFEQHRLREEDFRNDQVDAAELAADEAAVALYQVEVIPQGDGELGEVYVRFRDPASHNMVERSWTMLHEPQARAFDRATPTLQLAGMAALLAEKLRGGDEGRAINLDELAPVVNTLRGQYAGNRRVQELIAMYEQLRRRSQR